jgi:hypothetical protein
MPRFMAVHTLPLNEQELMAMLQEMAPKIPSDYTWKQSWCDFDDNKHFCEWEAASKEALEQAFQANNLPFDAVYPVRRFDVASMQLEP